MVKIGFLTQRMRSGFGVDVVVHNVAEGLVNKGHEVIVYCCESDETYKDIGYEIKRVLAPPEKYFPVWEINSIRTFRKLNDDSNDLFICETFPYYSSLLLSHKPCIMLDHGLPNIAGFSLLTKLNIKYITLTQNYIYFNFANKLCTISNFLKKQYPYHLRKRVKVIYNGVNHYPEVNNSRSIEFRDKIGVEKDDILLLYVGRLTPEGQPYKGVIELVNIYDHVKSKNEKVRLLMVGLGNEDDVRFLRMHGVIPYINAPVEEMPIIFSSCDVYVTATRWEGFNLPLGEAQYFGKPAVAYEIGAHPEIVENEKSAFLVSSKVDFIKFISLLAQDENLRMEMGANAKRNAKKFTWEKSVREYEKTILKILK